LNRKIKLHLYLPSIRNFIIFFMKNIPYEKWKKALSGIEVYAETTNDENLKQELQILIENQR